VGSNTTAANDYDKGAAQFFNAWIGEKDPVPCQLFEYEI